VSTSRDSGSPGQDEATERAGGPDPSAPRDGESGVRRTMSRRLAATLETWLDVDEDPENDDIPGANVEVDDEDDDEEPAAELDDAARGTREELDDGWVTLVGRDNDYSAPDFDQAPATVVEARPALPPPPLFADEDVAPLRPPMGDAAREDDDWLDRIAAPPEDSTELPALDLDKVRALRSRRDEFSSSGAFAAITDEDVGATEDSTTQGERTPPRGRATLAGFASGTEPTVLVPRAADDPDDADAFAAHPTRRDAELPTPGALYAPAEEAHPAELSFDFDLDLQDGEAAGADSSPADSESSGTADFFRHGLVRVGGSLLEREEGAWGGHEHEGDAGDSGIVAVADLQARLPTRERSDRGSSARLGVDTFDHSESSSSVFSVASMLAADLEAALNQADQTHDSSEEIMRLAREVEADLPSLSSGGRERTTSQEDPTPHIVFDSFPSGVVPGPIHDDEDEEHEDFTSGSYEFAAVQPHRAAHQERNSTGARPLPVEAPEGSWEEAELPEVEPIEDDLLELEPILGASAAYPLVDVLRPDATRESEPVGELSPERAWEVPHGGARLSVHNAKTAELPMEADLGDGASPPPEIVRYMRRLRDARPGPGGMGVAERRASATQPARIPDVILSARILRVRPTADDDGRLHILHEEIDLVRAVVECAASSAGAPVLLTGPAGSGKSHCINTLAAALAEPFLDRGATVNAFAGMISPLQIGGLPVPITLDLAHGATLSITTGIALLQAAIDSGDAPEGLLRYRGPVVLLADNLDLAVSQGREGYNPFLLLRELQRANPSWRVIVSGRPQSFSRLLALCEDTPEVRIIEIRPMRKSQSLAFLRGWQESQLPVPGEQDLDRSVPAALGTNPRLLEMLLGQWGRLADSIGIAVAEDGLVGATRLLLDAICVQVQARAGHGTHRRDLRFLAEVVSALRGEVLPVEEVHGLIEAGQLKEDIDALLAGGIVELRMVRGERTSGGLYFAHPLFREVLLAEQIVEEVVQLGLSDELQAHAAAVGDDVPAALSSEDVTRLLQVARSRSRRLRPHLRTSLAHTLASVLESQADVLSLRGRPRLARLLAVCILLSSALVRAGAEAPSLLEVRGGALTAVLEALARAGEDHLRDALARDWTTGSLTAIEAASGLFPVPK
jgi:hypothetical protein